MFFKQYITIIILREERPKDPGKRLSKAKRKILFSRFMDSSPFGFRMTKFLHNPHLNQIFFIQSSDKLTIFLHHRKLIPKKYRDLLIDEKLLVSLLLSCIS